MKILLIDGDYIPFLVCHNKKDDSGKVTKEKSLVDIITEIDVYMSFLLNTTETDAYIGALTTGRCFRYDIFPEYKIKRKSLPRIKYINSAKQYLKEEYKFIDYKGLEADDIISILKYSYLNHVDDKLIIASPDKDMLNLEGEHYNPREQKYVTVSAEEALKFFWKSMIAGDTADGIAGLKGKGEAYANKFLEHCDDKNIQQEVFGLYIKQLEEKEGINEFYKNYKCLKILDKYEGFSLDNDSLPVIVKDRETNILETKKLDDDVF